MQACLTEWLAKELKLEKRVALVITRAFRINNPKLVKKWGSRDIIITFSDQRAKMCVLKMAREMKTFCFKEQKIEIFQDLPAEVLVKQRGMKDIIKQLIDMRVRYKWSGVTN